MTADSLPSQTTDAFGVYPKAAGEHGFILDLMAGARERCRVLVEWLETAEEDDSDEDDDDDEEEDSDEEDSD